MNALKMKWFSIVLILFLLLNGSVVTKVQAVENHDELFIYIGDSLMKVKEEDWKAIENNLSLFEKDWAKIKKTGKLAGKVEGELAAVRKSLGRQDVESVNQALSKLSNAFVQYDEEQNPVDKEREKEKVQLLLPHLNDLKSTVEEGNFTKANTLYRQFNSKWTAAEKIVRTESVASYGEIETYMAFIRIAISEEPPNKEKALNSIDRLNTAINHFLSGNVSKKIGKDHSLSDITNLLAKSSIAMEKQSVSEATEHLNQLLIIWPMVEGDVQTRDSKLYNDMETKVPTVISLLNSQNGDLKKAAEIVKELHTRLKPLLNLDNYTMWDSALILLREGLEAILIVATLVGFLKKTGNSNKQKWIWLGVVFGLLASAILAVFINIIFSKIGAASSREYIEGITGIVAVAMMLSVGAWLHNKTNVQNWSRYINRQMGQALATGSLFSFALISFLSIFREGAETIIFYAGMAPKISLNALLSGIALALVIIVILGFLIIHYSVKIPIRLFFLTATILIYILSFKILGISIHALQISNVLPTHSLYPFPFIEWIGLYPTLETFLPQLGLLVVIFIISIVVKKREKNSQIAA